MAFKNKVAVAVCVAGIPVLFGCSGPNDTRDPTTNLGTATQAATTTDAIQREITIATEPNAKCTVSAPGSPVPMPVWADDTGIVHLWAPRAQEADLLECVENGSKVQHLLDLADEATFAPAAARVVSTARSILPALKDPLGPRQDELIAAGYPPRPDPKLAAPLYEKWLDMVSSPALLVQPNLVERPDLHFYNVTYTTHTIWGGDIMDVASIRYAWSLATFTIPGFSPGGATSTKISMWAGLDGWGTSDVIQDGIYYESTGSTGAYWAWYEYYPNNMVFNTTMVPSPNDSMTFWAWEGDINCVAGVGHTGYGCFWYKDNTTTLTAGTFKVTAPNGSFQGKTAEAVIERMDGATVSKFTSLAAMEFAAADATGAWHNITSDHFQDSKLVNGSGQTLVSVDFCCTDYAAWTWVRGQ